MNRYMTLGLAGALLLTLSATADDRPAGEAVAAGGQRQYAGYHGSSSKSEYSVQWNRPAKVGQKMRVRADGVQERTITTMHRGSSEKGTEATNLSVHLEAEAQVLAVDSNGRPTRVGYKVGECTATIDGRVTEVARPGSLITAEREQQRTAFDINGRPAQRSASEALQLVASLNTEGADMDDRILGSHEPRGIGESWSINTEAARRTFQQGWDQPISETDIFGITTLVDVLEHRGEPCLLVHSQVSTKNFLPGLGPVPPGMKVASANMTSTYQGYLPVDTTMPVMSDSVRMDMSAVLTSASPTGAEMRINGVYIVDVDSTPLPASTASISEFDSVPE